MIQVLATVIFFIVFIELFVALSIYIGVIVYRFFKKEEEKEKKL